MSQHPEYFRTSERLGFRNWREGDEDLAAAIWGDAEGTRLTGGPFTPLQGRQRLADEIAKKLRDNRPQQIGHVAVTKPTRGARGNPPAAGAAPQPEDVEPGHADLRHAVDQTGVERIAHRLGLVAIDADRLRPTRKMVRTSLPRRSAGRGVARADRVDPFD